MIKKPKYTITLIDTENVAYSAVSNMQPRLNALEKNIYLIGMQIYEM